MIMRATIAVLVGLVVACTKKTEEPAAKPAPAVAAPAPVAPDAAVPPDPPQRELPMVIVITPSILDEAQTRKILDDLNDICADTWCEGNYSYSFTALGCSKPDRCQIVFFAKTGDPAEGTQKTFTGTLNVTSASKIVKDGELVEEHFHVAMTKAIDTWEAQKQKTEAPAHK